MTEQTTERKRAEASVEFLKTDDGPILSIQIPLFVQNPKPFAYGTLEVAREELQNYFRKIEFLLHKQREATGLIKPGQA